MKIFLFLVVFSGTYFSIQAQSLSLKGIVEDRTDKSPLSGATIKFYAKNDSLVNFNVVADKSGAFSINNLDSLSYVLTLSSVGYDPEEKTITLKDSSIDLGIIYLSKQSKLLKEVIVQATPPPVKQKADTLEYNAGSFKVNPDANAEDLVKKMPGITIEQGTVKAGGEDVKKVTVDGREFFGEDATAALKNLPAEVIDKIQVFDRLSEQAQLTGFEDANTTKGINIITKANMRNGQFGRLFAGYGTEDRYAAGGNVSFFNGNRRISFVGLANNVNQQNFATEDLLGVTSSQNRSNGGGQRGGGGNQRGGGRGFGSSGNFLVGQQSGISKTNSFGVNYSDLWGKKVSVSGSYFFNNSNNTNNQLVNRQNFLGGDTSQYYKENSISTSNNYNHRFNMRMEYKIDSSNTLIITPNISFQKNNALSDLDGINSFNASDLISQSTSRNTTSTSGYNINNGILFRHGFNKKGRSISVNLNTGFNKRDGSSYLQAINQYYKGGGNIDDSLQQFSDQFSNGYQLSTNIAYTEPIGKKGQIQLNYNPSYSRNDADYQTFEFDPANEKYSIIDTSLSNKFNNIYTTQNGGVTYRIGDRSKMFSVGMALQNAHLSSDQTFPGNTKVTRDYSNFLPSIMYNNKISTKSNLRVSYRANTNAPSISQLQDVIINTNSLLLRTGNPDLQQQYSHNLVTRYSYTNSLKGQSFFANLFVQKTDHYIANATFIAAADSVISPTITLHKGSQLTKPVNLDGYWNIRSFLTFGMPLKFIKSNLNWNAGYSYIKAPGMINNQQNLSTTQNYNLGAVLGSNISEFVDFNLSYTANFNVVKNSIQPQLNNNYVTRNAGFQLNLLSKNGWVFQNDLNNQTYSGLTDGFNQNFWLWNMSAGKKFLKNQQGELRLSVFDLLKQNRSISRTATETYVEDVRSQVLQQYFMLTFSYRLRNFGSKR